MTAVFFFSFTTIFFMTTIFLHCSVGDKPESFAPSQLPLELLPPQSLSATQINNTSRSIVGSFLWAHRKLSQPSPAFSPLHSPCASRLPYAGKSTSANPRRPHFSGADMNILREAWVCKVSLVHLLRVYGKMTHDLARVNINICAHDDTAPPGLIQRGK